jgi:MFS superfamily sulfate permease-like transporter
VATIIALSGLCFGLLVAVAVGVALTLFLVIYELDLLGVTELRATPDLFDVQTVGSDTAPIDGLLILRVDGPLYTANVRGVNRAGARRRRRKQADDPRADLPHVARRRESVRWATERRSVQWP